MVPIWSIKCLAIGTMWDAGHGTHDNANSLCQSLSGPVSGMDHSLKSFKVSLSLQKNGCYLALGHPKLPKGSLGRRQIQFVFSYLWRGQSFIMCIKYWSKIVPSFSAKATFYFHRKCIFFIEFNKKAEMDLMRAFNQDLLLVTRPIL